VKLEHLLLGYSSWSWIVSDPFSRLSSFDDKCDCAKEVGKL
jgi:hypothetical protein